MAVQNEHVVTSGQRIFWLDMEFTGLNIEDDVIIEAGAAITDYQLNILDEYTTFIHHPSSQVSRLIARNAWWQDRGDHRDAMLKGVESAPKSLEVVAEEIAHFASRWCDIPIILAGNSIHSDRKWVERDFPLLAEKLHYRMIDVSTLKLLGSGLLGIEFEKKEGHRAPEDIRESIEELRFLLLSMGNKQLVDLLKSKMVPKSQS